MSRREVKVPHVPRSFIVPRNICIPTPAGLTLAASPIHMLGVDQWRQSRSFSAASWGTEVASLAEALTYSKTAYDTFQALREKFGKIIVRCMAHLYRVLCLEAEQALTNKLRLDQAALVESYETRLKQRPSAFTNDGEKNSVKDEPMDADFHQTNLANRLLETQIIKDRLEQAQIDLGSLD